MKAPIHIKDKVKFDRRVKIIFFIIVIFGALTAKCQTAVIYKEGNLRTLVVYSKDSVFANQDERSTQKRVIIYKGRKIRFNMIRYDYARWFIVNNVIKTYK